MNLPKFSGTGSLTALLNKVSYGDHLRPQRDWIVIISVAGILLIGSAGWSYWLFERISWTESSLTMGARGNLNTSVLDQVRSIFDQRAAERAHYLNDYRFVDPSK